VARGAWRPGADRDRRARHSLRPDLLRSIVTEAVEPFYDRTLAHRVWQARSAWIERASEALSDQLNSETMLMIRARAEMQIEQIRAQIREIESATEMAIEGLDLPIPEVPEAEIDKSLQPLPLVSTDWSWAEQTRALIARKRYGNGGAP
jgi:hypothetical protein